MNVKIIETGKTVSVNASYGMRLIEQGKAILAPKAKKTIKPPKEATGKTGEV